MNKDEHCKDFPVLHLKGMTIIMFLHACTCSGHRFFFLVPGVWPSLGT